MWFQSQIHKAMHTEQILPIPDLLILVPPSPMRSIFVFLLCFGLFLF